MVDAWLEQSPLSSLHLDARAAGDAGKEDAGVTMRVRERRGQFVLRGDAGDAAFTAAARAALKLDLPLDPNTVAGSAKGTHALWLGPGEWLIVTKADAGARTVKGLTGALGSQHAAVTDVGESRAVIELAGPNARQVLMKACTLDFHPGVFGPGRCAQTLVARASVIVHQTGPAKATGAPVYELYVARSFAEYLWAWLEDAAGEYGVKVVA